MNLVLDDNVKKALRKAGVSTLYLFGSRAQGLEAPTSDFDFAVLMKDASRVKPERQTLDLYQELYDILTDLLPPQDRNPVVDIVFLQSGVSLELQGNVVRYGKPIFDDDPTTRANYEAQVMLRCADFAPILAQIDKAILQSL